jgi:hypothetical protein
MTTILTIWEAVGDSNPTINMVKALKKQFFQLDSPTVDPIACRLPRNVLERSCPAICIEEVHKALNKGSNMSAPGLSGIGYQALKWAIVANPGYMLTIFQWYIDLGYCLWHASIVVIIPKPNKPNYSVAKAYRPILLLECLGKVLEWVIACCMAWHMDHKRLLPVWKFGSC